MRPYDTIYQIDGTPLLVPDAPVERTFSDLDDQSAGRDESGYMHRSVLRHRVRTWGLSYSVLTAQELAYLETLLDGKATFRFSCEEGVCTAYCAKQEVRLYDRTRGVYKQLRLDIIEC